MDYAIREGNYEKLGVQKKDDAVIFTFEGEKEENCSILFYGKKAEPVCKILVPEEYCRGSVRSVAVTGKLWKNLRYNYEINGKIITDTYATRIIGREKWNDKTRSEKDYFICGGAYPQAFDWENDRQPEIKRQQMVMYKLHVRGFSMEDTSCPRKERGTFRAITDKIPYLKKLGITTIELMPAYEFEEQVIPKKTVLPDYLKWESHGEDLIKPESVQPVEKIYVCIAKGIFKEKSGRIETLIGRDSRDRKKMAVVNENGKIAISNYEVIDEGKNHSLVKVRIETGRTHQIRVHMKHLNHPIMGDTTYGNGNDGADRQMLHAYRLKFIHPTKNTEMTVIAPLPEDFKRAAKHVGVDISKIESEIKNGK